MSQLTMFDGNKKFIIDKPIRLISMFSGYDSQLFSLKYLGANVESWRTCEWAIKSIQALKDAHFKDDNKDYSQGLSDVEVFEQLHKFGISANYNEPMTYEQIKRLGSVKARTIYNNIKATHNMVNIQQVHAEDLGIEEIDKYCYVMTYSFPCQDLSLAGKGAGMEKGSGTRSGMLWEVERILEECKDLPQVLLMENVPEVIGTNNIKHFAKWLEKLESLGYHCYWQVLNAKDYGVPQNRERCFMVSILGDYYYEFPKPIKLEHKLKDLLEDEVDEKFYLSDKMKEYIKASNGKWTGNDDKSIINRDIGVTINTRVGNTRADCSDYICDDLPENYNLKTLCLNGCMEHRINGIVRVRKFDVDKKGLVSLLRNTKKESGLSNKQIAEKLNNPLTEVEHWFRQDDSFAIPNENIWFELKKVLKIETNEFDESILTFEEKPNVFDMSNRAYDEKGCSPTLTTQNSPSIVIHGKQCKCSPTLDTRCDCLGVVKNYRIRKLTPKECFRLMGVRDEDFENIAKNQSNASLYHLAGDSIVVDVLMAIFKEML